MYQFNVTIQCDRINVRKKLFAVNVTVLYNSDDIQYFILSMYKRRISDYFDKKKEDENNKTRTEEKREHDKKNINFVNYKLGSFSRRIPLRIFRIKYF